MEKLTTEQMLENALREIAASACDKGGEWASDQAFTMLDYVERQKEADQKSA